jgi:hypothetical protein
MQIRDKLIAVHVTADELEQIVECAGEKPPNLWARYVITDIARRVSWQKEHYTTKKAD